MPLTIRIGHLTYTIVVDDDAVREYSVREQGDYAGFSSSGRQTIALAVTDTRTGKPLGADYRRETLLHEILHSCLRVTGCDPDADAKAGVVDVEERVVNAMAGPLLGVLRDHPEVLTWLVERTDERGEA